MKPRYTNLSSIEPSLNYPLKMYYADEVDARVAELEKRIADLSKCDCGCVLSRSCPICDNDD